MVVDAEYLKLVGVDDEEIVTKKMAESLHWKIADLSNQFRFSHLAKSLSKCY